MKTGNVLFALLLMTAGERLANVAYAQTPASPPASSKELVVDVDLVNVFFSVLDKKGRAIADLEQNEISILEDDATQKITNFTREAGGPIALAMLVDTSNSIRAQFKVEQEAAIDFFHTTVRDRKSTRLNSSHLGISYAVFCLK